MAASGTIFLKNQYFSGANFFKNTVFLGTIFLKMYHKRLIDNFLIKWKSDPFRKPLLLRGARQVGKSTSIRNLGSQYQNFVELNLDEDTRAKSIFDDTESIHELVDKISLYSQKPLRNGESLLFIDEIQNSSKAIHFMRYFHEKYPDIHIVAAGSLLEFALKNMESFGVGRLVSYFMYAFSFDEYLEAIGSSHLIAIKQSANATKPVDNVFHTILLDQLKKFMLLGGLPEAISVYIQSGNLLKAQSVLFQLILSIQDDFRKYDEKVPITRLKNIFLSVAQQTGSKFVFTHADSQSQHYQIKEAVELLRMAGLIYPVIHTTASGFPLGGKIDLKKQKLLLFDSGVYQRLAGLDLKEYVSASNENLINNGPLAEMFFGLEYIKYGSPEVENNLYYWQREIAHSQAEVDYVIAYEGNIIPVEIKASTKGSMQSLRVFMSEKKSAYGIRSSLENFTEYENIKTIPLYAISNLRLR